MSRPRKTDLSHVEIYTNGACKGNPGPGGWGVRLQSGQHVQELFGGELNTTNNRMEMTAVIEGLSALKRPCQVTLYLDSEYVRKVLLSGFMAGKPVAGGLQPNNL